MGSAISAGMKETMEDNFKKNQEFMLTTQKMQLERQMAMQQLMQQKMMASQIARQREMFNWVAAFTGTISTGLLLGFLKTKKPVLLGPIVVIGFVTGYQYDMVYGNKLLRIRAEAEKIIQDEKDLLNLPNGKLTVNEVDNFRLK